MIPRLVKKSDCPQPPAKIELDGSKLTQNIRAWVSKANADRAATTPQAKFRALFGGAE